MWEQAMAKWENPTGGGSDITTSSFHAYSDDTPGVVGRTMLQVEIGNVNPLNAFTWKIHCPDAREGGFTPRMFGMLSGGWWRSAWALNSWIPYAGGAFDYSAWSIWVGAARMELLAALMDPATAAYNFGPLHCAWTPIGPPGHVWNLYTDTWLSTLGLPTVKAGGSSGSPAFETQSYGVLDYLEAADVYVDRIATFGGDCATHGVPVLKDGTAGGTEDLYFLSSTPGQAVNAASIYTGVVDPALSDALISLSKRETRIDLNRSQILVDLNAQTIVGP
jgi:hypothetical protein